MKDTYYKYLYLISCAIIGVLIGVAMGQDNVIKNKSMLLDAYDNLTLKCIDKVQEQNKLIEVYDLALNLKMEREQDDCVKMPVGVYPMEYFNIDDNMTNWTEAAKYRFSTIRIEDVGEIRDAHAED